MKAIFAIFITLMAAAPPACGQAKEPAKRPAPPEWNLYVGTYTRPQKSKGIYAWRFQPATADGPEKAGILQNHYARTCLARRRPGDLDDADQGSTTFPFK